MTTSRAEGSPPVVLTPGAPVADVDGARLWLVSVEVWRYRVVLRTALVGGAAPRTGAPHPAGALRWTVAVDGQDVPWAAASGGGAGLEDVLDQVFVAGQPLPPAGSLRLRWTGAGTSDGELEMPYPGAPAAGGTPSPGASPASRPGGPAGAV